MANWMEPYNRSGGGLFDARGGGLFDLIREFDSWFDSGSRGTLLNTGLDVDEQDDSYRIFIDMPGVRAEDVRMETQGSQLLIQAERREQGEQQARPGMNARRSIRFQRVITLPEAIQVGGIQAALENGVLEIVVPKSEDAAPRKIPVKAARQELSGSQAVNVNQQASGVGEVTQGATQAMEKEATPESQPAKGSRASKGQDASVNQPRH